MGIADINSTLKDVVSKVVQVINSFGYGITSYGFRERLPIVNLRGKKIAFDFSIILNAKMITAHNEIIAKMVNITQAYDRKILQRKTFEAIIAFFVQIISEGITPVIVFDGQTHELKKSTVAERHEKKQEKIKHVQELTNSYLSTMAFDRTEGMMNELRDAMKNMIRIQKEDIMIMWDIFEKLGIRCLTAPHDAEKLCASLSREGIVSAVYGNDTDNYPLGTSILITKIYHEGGIGLVYDCVNMEEIMYCLTQYCGWKDYQGNQIPFTLDNLVDLCILHGCDFNERMKEPTKRGNNLKSVGAKGALNKIVQFRKFENFPINLYPFMSCLNIYDCRLLFSYVASNETQESTNINWNFFSRNKQDIFDCYDLKPYIRIAASKIDKTVLHLKNTQDKIIEEDTTNIQNLSMNKLNNQISTNVQKCDDNRNISYSGYVL
uniref:XPG N-terminal domain-containing protein n=1 Tax=viral metagenome TaxID=1070528 RepID=A0A6C0BFB8_9ZZZZ